MRTLAVVSTLLLLSYGGMAMGAPTQTPSTADWTVLVFMNGDNNLEQYALADFYEMAEVGSTKSVNIVVQLDRNGGYTSDYNRWTDTRRFLVKKDRAPLADAAVQALGEVNMGDPQSLENFIHWGMTTYPANHYALIIWDHGQGYRDAVSTGFQGDRFRSAHGMPFRSVSHDDTDRDQLYNIEVQQALRAGLNGRKLDLLGFDACLMGMVETAYAVREFSDIMVGSEDLEPGDGWAYHLWLKDLVRNPRRTADKVARAIVRSYPVPYRSHLANSDALLTLSAIRLSELDSLAGAVSTLSNAMVKALDTEVGAIKEARQASPVFARDNPRPGDQRFHHVDLKKFATEYQRRTANPAIQQALTAMLAHHQRAVLKTFAGAIRENEGASGLAIYFPAGRNAYVTDIFEEHGYEKDNQQYPVAFVREQQWADFLHAYFARVP
ncbi:clostripain-related cysteine peptidase [Corallococcus llansteffanensis]|nr:clostripain-related cysteine peptidase [Corallococcus llansteffanensis]